MPAIEHLRYLAETIGPRGSATDAELQAARYCADALRSLGLKPNMQQFSTARSNWRPFALTSAFLLFATAIFLTGGPAAAAAALLFGSVTLASAVLELSFRPNPLRWLLPRGISHNVWSRFGPAAERRSQVVLLGHIDTHRTPLAFSTDRWLRFYGTLVPLGLLASLSLLLIFAASLLVESDLWRIFTLPPGLFVLVLLLLTFQADLTPYSPGANDNASGASVVLSLAESLAAEPLLHTEAWLVLSGSEEVGCHGAEAFAREFKSELPNAAWLTIDSVAGASTTLTYLRQETFLLVTRSDPGLLDVAEQVAQEHPELHARSSSFAGAFTEGAIGGKHGFRVLTFISRRDDGGVPEWHRPTDMVDRIDPHTLTHAEAFILEFLRKLDSHHRSDKTIGDQLHG